MKKIQPSESIIKGEWKFKNKRVIADKNCQRIEFLIESELDKISIDNSNWSTLYLDSRNETYWELTYPESEMQGGGPPKLEKITNLDTLREKYKIK